MEKHKNKNKDEVVEQIYSSKELSMFYLIITILVIGYVAAMLTFN